MYNMIKEIKENLSNVNLNMIRIYNLGLGIFGLNSIVNSIMPSYKYEKIKDKFQELYIKIPDTSEIPGMSEDKLLEMQDMLYQARDYLGSMKNLSELSSRNFQVGVATVLLTGVVNLLYDKIERDIKYTDKGAILENKFDNYFKK